MRFLISAVKIFKEEKGYTMPAAVATVVILGIMVTAVSGLSISGTRQNKLDSDKTAAIYLAESGVNDAVYRIVENAVYFEDRDIATDPANYSSSAYYNFGAGNSFAVWVHKLGGGKMRIAARGISNKIPKIVEQDLNLPLIFPPPPSDTTEGKEYVVTKDDASLNYISGYNAPVMDVTMPTDVSYVNKNIGENQNVTLNAGTYYFNQLTVGRNGTLTINGPATIYVKESSYEHEDNAVTFYSHSKIDINGEVTFKIAGELEFKTNVTLDNQHGRAAFFVGELIQFGRVETGENNETVIDTTIGMGDPSKLTFYTPGDVEFANSSQVIGGVCAPNAKEVDLRDKSKVTGALVVGSIHVDHNHTRHGDDHEDKGVEHHDHHHHEHDNLLAAVNYDPRMEYILMSGGSFSLSGWNER